MRLSSGSPGLCAYAMYLSDAFVLGAPFDPLLRGAESVGAGTAVASFSWA